MRQREEAQEALVRGQMEARMGLEERVAKEVERVSARAEQDLTMVRLMGVYEYLGLFCELHVNVYRSVSYGLCF